MDLDRYLEAAYEGKLLTEKQFSLLCGSVRELMATESNVPFISSPVTVCGDIHGQFWDLLEIFKLAGNCPDQKYIFLGDYVDRGRHSVECIQLLLLLKAKHPSRVFLVRGNHETRRVSMQYGFHEECIKKYGNSVVWSICNDLFDYMPISALIDGKIFCVHGGHSPNIPSIDKIHTFDRFKEIELDHELADLMWSDPSNDIDYWDLNERGTGYLFGWRVSKEFSHLNNLELTIRSHQLVMNGFRYMFDDKSLLTVWSAPNYVYRCGNAASVIKLNGDLDREILVFMEKTGQNNVTEEADYLPYFM